MSPLGGSGRNVLATTADGRRFVFKSEITGGGRGTADLERYAIAAIPSVPAAPRVPRLVETKGGEPDVEVDEGDGRIAIARLFTYVDGVSWVEARPATAERRRDLGRMLGALDGYLAAVDHPLTRRTHMWDLAEAGQHREKIALIEDPARRRLLEAAFHLYAAAGKARLAALPHSLIHGDANDENVLVAGDRVVGLIDFGDALWNPTVCELAIAVAYAMLDEADPLAAGADVVAGYQSERPLSAQERKVLFPLVCGRLAASVAIAAANRRVDPDRAALFVTEAAAWRLLAAIVPVDPGIATARLNGAQGADASLRPEADDIADKLRARDVHISRALSVAYRPDAIAMRRGEGQYLFDERGRPYLDLVNNVCHVGHCHPRVVDAGQAQMARLNTNTRYLYDGLVEYAERICATLPAPLEICFFVNSGSEANELALRLAAAHTKRQHVLVVDGAYHGNTDRLIAISPYKFMGQGGAGRPEPWVHVAPIADGYRGPHRGQDRSAGEAYARDLKTAIDGAGAPIAAFITEPMWSCGGQVIPPEGYLAAAFGHVREAGGVCIADEVQTGLGRAGTHFWAFETQNVIPDIVVLGKPLGNGHPIGAVITTREIAASFENGMEFFSTFGGNPVSCAIGLAVLDVMRDDALQAHADTVGRRFVESLRELIPRHQIVGDVRGAGLFIGVELVRDRDTLEPAAGEADALVRRMRQRGILLSTDGPHHNVIKIKPPMVLTADDVDMVVRILDEELP
ncbi:MAG TPA: aminotransferase class III-fold pyridoxal phosphate-dependent enzyme [Vicinamibacterales bacterium]|nr:aminotransferase class III-fold pyridoxal phosphate-dependent enzyme [Vicinamibacterales bacterium]